MPYARRRTVRRPVRRTRRTARPTRALAVRRRPAMRVHSFTRFDGNPYNTFGNAAYAPLLNSFYFSLDKVQNYGEFANLYDFYKLTHVQVRFTLNVDPSSQTATTSYIPRLFYVIDHDDDTAPASLAEMREHDRCKVKNLNPGRTVVVNIKPAALAEMFRSGLTTTYTPKWKQWIDMAAPNCKHYGLKWAVDNLTNTNYYLSTELKYWFSCKDVR
ncbi:capsid [uncultured virus]|uniref:Capsid n=1 Tax=uncultured virus TaxID=340016 RepID=A0A2K9LSI1_9VIRU|nr:capsid [uncultured virus]